MQRIFHGVINSGCFERYLQRKYKNPLFPESERKVTAKEIAQAKAKDKGDADALRKDFEALAIKIQKLPKEISVPEMNKLRAEVDKLMERTASIGGGDVAVIDKGLYELRKVIIESIRVAAVGNKEGLKALEEAESVWHANTWKYFNPFVAQMTRKDTPIQGKDVVPSLLTEDPVTIQTVLIILNEDTPEIAQLLRKTGVRMLRNTKGLSEHFVNERLIVLEK